MVLTASTSVTLLSKVYGLLAVFQANFILSVTSRRLLVLQKPRGYRQLAAAEVAYQCD